ncbi:glycosyltransferase family 4 protein [Terasakiella sp.]|uniref:glycosyltransferase family 4 protein n=1 Tax=Terasakiella sp. TaxID=2034861 RepID=UPI003AA83D8E
MRVQLITQLFDPENAIKGLSFVKELSSCGYDIEVVTTYPSYPGGRIYYGYKMRIVQVEEIDGVRVVRLPSYISHGKSAIGRLLSYATFSISAFVYSLLFTSRPDVIYSYYPPMMGGVAGALLGFIKRRPFIYDVQDLWPEALSATGMLKDRRIIRCVDLVINWVYRRAAAIVVLSDGYKNTLISKGVPESKIHRIYNWCDESRIQKQPSTVQEENEYFDITYAGNFGPAQALSFVLEAARSLQDDGHKAIRFLFLGDGIECNELKQQAASLGLSNVVFKGRVPPEQVGAELQAADALLVHLADQPVFSITIPSKTQAYMAIGKPILMAVAGESAELIKKAGAGIISRPCAPDEIAKAALAMSKSSPAQLASFGDCAKNFYITNMSQKNGVEKISLLMKSLIKK